MRFSERHPYLFWQLIGWCALALDFGFCVLCAFSDFGEWQYPVVVFIFIFAVIMIILTPILIHARRQMLIPGNQDPIAERFMRHKIYGIMKVRGYTRKYAVPAALSMVVIFYGGLLASFYVVNINLGLAFVMLVTSVIMPIAIGLIPDKIIVKHFFSVKNGEKYVDFTQPADFKVLEETEPVMLLFSGEPTPEHQNFFYNWLHFYLRSERLTLYKISASELPYDFQFSDMMQDVDNIIFIPEEQLDLANEKNKLFRLECDIIGTFPFNMLIDGYCE